MKLPLDAALAVRTRPLFAYPAVARYDGKGDVNTAASWHAAMPASTPDGRIDWLWGPAAR